jgi:hypothetical protein
MGIIKTAVMLAGTAGLIKVTAKYALTQLNISIYKIFMPEQQNHISTP